MSGADPGRRAAALNAAHARFGKFAALLIGRAAANGGAVAATLVAALIPVNLLHVVLESPVPSGTALAALPFWLQTGRDLLVCIGLAPTAVAAASLAAGWRAAWRDAARVAAGETPLGRAVWDASFVAVLLGRKDGNG